MAGANLLGYGLTMPREVEPNGYKNLRKPRVTRKDKDEKRRRDLDIWKLWVGGKHPLTIAKTYDMTARHVEQIITTMKQEIAANEPTVADFRQMIVHGTLDVISEMTDRLHSEPAPAFSNGKRMTKLNDDGTESPVYDYGMQMMAADRILKAHERLARITGVEAPTEHNVTVTVQAQQMAENAAREALARLTQAANMPMIPADITVDAIDVQTPESVQEDTE